MIYIDFDNLNKKHTNLLDKIFKRNKKKYEIFLEKNLKNNDFFFLSNFLSKDIFSNLTYIGYCHIIFIESLLKKTRDNILINISNYYLYNNIKLNFLRKKNLKITCNSYWSTKLLLYLKIIYRFFYLLNFVFWQLINKSESRVQKIKKKNINIYDTTFTNSCFKKGNFTDRYYENEYFKNGNNFLCPENLLFKNTSSYLKILSKKKINCLYRFDFLNLSDYLVAIKKVIFTNFLSKYYLNNKNIRYLVYHDNLNNICNFNYFFGLLNYYFFLNLKKKNINVSNIFHKFENQSAGKGFVLGSKRYFPKSNIVGICDYFINYQFSFSRIPLRYEVQKKLVPIKNVLVNRSYVKDFSSHYKKFKIKFNSFRYKKYKLIKNQRINKINRMINISVFLPIQKDQTIKILNQIKNLEFNKKSDFKCKFFLKFHPNFNENFIKKYSKLLDKNIFICNRNLEETMKRSNLSIVGASTTSIESILFKVPVLCPVNSFFIYDSPLINLVPKKLYSMYFNNDDLKRKIQIYARLLSNKKHIKLLEKTFSKGKKKIIKDL